MLLCYFWLWLYPVGVWASAKTSARMSHVGRGGEEAPRSAALLGPRCPVAGLSERGKDVIKFGNVSLLCRAGRGVAGRGGAGPAAAPIAITLGVTGTVGPGRVTQSRAELTPDCEL